MMENGFSPFPPGLMSMRRFVTHLAFLCWLCMPARVAAQTAPIPLGPVHKFQDQVYYLDASGQDWMFLNANPEEPILIRFQGKKFQIPSPVNLGTVTGICPSGSTLWACVIEERPSGARMIILRWDLAQPTKGWERLGEVEHGNGLPSFLVPLRREDQFLGVANGLGFVDSDRSGASVAARFRLKNGMFHFEGCVEMALEGVGRIAKQVPKPDLRPKKEEPLQPWQLASCEIDPPALHPTLVRPSVSPDHVALCAAQAGVVWVFERDKGSLRRTYNLDGLTKDDLKKVRLLNFSVLGTAFDPSGRLIVAKRSRELTQLALKLANETTDPAEAAAQKDEFRMIADHYKDIQWVALDPETGARQDLDAPADFPTATPSFRRQTSLRFLMSPTGGVKTNASCTWDSVVREAGLSLEAPKKDTPEEAKKAKPAPTPLTEERKGIVQ